MFFLFQYVIVNNSSFKYHPRYILNKDYNNFPPPTNKQAEKNRKEMQIEKEGGRERKREKQGREGKRERRKEGEKERARTRSLLGISI